MISKTYTNNVRIEKSVSWQALLSKALLFICLSVYLGYLCWTSQRTLIFVEVGLLFMAIAYFKPYRKRVIPTYTEICLELFAVIMTFAVFFELYNLAIDQPSVKLLLSVNQIGQFHEWVMGWPIWLTIVCYYIVADFIAYWGHRLLHSRWFWHSHAFHHAAKHLNLLSGMRTSFLHVVIAYLPYTIVWVFFPMPQAGSIGVSIIIFEMVNQHYTHSNIRFPFQKQLEWVFVTPRFHFVHHSAVRKYSDSNYGFIFSIWDRIFGTYTDPENVDPNEPLGLNYENSTWRLMIGLPPKKSVAKS
ncbi:MAG: sterol desaturase family protein [Methylococcaceae bacterium]|nr:sterol desaturase family protein [Methylococcaceae bacterium]